MSRMWLRFAAVALAVAVSGPARAAAKLAGAWSFEGKGDRIEDLSGNGLHGTLRQCALAPGRSGQALKADGKGGMTVPDSPLLRGQGGFTLECWVRADRGPGPAMNIISKPDEFMLRVDPAAAGGTISLFIRSSDGGWEPRARGPRLVAGKWLHILTSWDGRRARLWVDRHAASSDRACKCPATTEPLVVAGPAKGLAGFVGFIDEVRIHSGPVSHHWLTRRVYGLVSPQDGPKRREAAFDFRSGLHGWQGDGKVELVRSALEAKLPSEQSLLRVTGLAVDAATHPVCTVRMAADSGERGVCIFASNKMLAEVPFRLRSDGAMHSYTLRCGGQLRWGGEIDAMGLRVEGGKPDTTVRVESIRLDATSHAPADLRILAVAPERRICGLGQDATVQAWVQNVGGAAENVAVRLAATAGIAVQGSAVATIPRLVFLGQKELAWRIRSDAPCEGSVRVEVECQREVHAAMTRPVRFAADPAGAAVALARSRPWLTAGYPRAMDFRHLWRKYVPFYEPNTVFLVDMIADKIDAAREFKARYPDRLVLMQVNDEPNGLWGSWHCVPREFAAKAGLECDPAIFPMPKFRGYWLLGPRAGLSQDLAADAQSVQIAVPDTKWFTHVRYGRRQLRDVLIYRTVKGQPDWAHSEYASVSAVDDAKSTVTIERWPVGVVGEWRAFRRGAAFVAPSVASIYRLSKGPIIKTWVPNLTRFCPRDPATGMNAAEWWARHFARLWHTRVAQSEPHPDGLEFDGLSEGAVGDCDNDGVVDGCEIGGVNHWRLGIYDFFRKLRQGGRDWPGMGDGLILADASSVWSPRSLGLLNGSENEEFPSFSGPDYLPSGLDLFRVWCERSAKPACSYVQGRFRCETYLEDDWLRVRRGGKFQPDSLVRLSIACACMGSGIYTFRAGSRRDHGAILDGTHTAAYLWDEYHEGRAGRWNWLGLPVEQPQRMTDHLGPDLLPSTDAADQWQLVAQEPGAQITGPRPARVGDRVGVEVDVTAIDTSARPQRRRQTMARQGELRSPETAEELDLGKDYCVEFWIRAEPRHSEPDAARPIGVGLRTATHLGVQQWVLASRLGRPVALTLQPGAKGRCRAVFFVAVEPGPVFISGLRLREGSAEVLSRRFEHGLALANGSRGTPYTFDLGTIAPNRRYLRFRGAQAPDVNTGQPAGPRVTVPPVDGLLLRAE